MNKKEYHLPNGKIIEFEYDDSGVGEITVDGMDALIELLKSNTND